MVSQNVFHRASSHQTRDLECFADSSNIPWNPLTILCPDLIATILQRCLLPLCALLFLQCHLFLICVALTNNDSRKDLHKTCQIPKKCQCKWLWVSSLAPRTSLNSSGSPGKFLFCTGMIEIHWVAKSLPPQHIHDCYAIHFLHWEFLWSAVIKSQNFTLWARLYQHVFCKKPSCFFFVFKQLSQFGSFGKCV